jgi:hypothetical protein
MVKPKPQPKLKEPYLVRMWKAQELFPDIFAADLRQREYRVSVYSPLQAFAWAYQKEGHSRRIPRRVKDRLKDIVECLYRPPEEKEPNQLRLF